MNYKHSRIRLTSQIQSFHFQQQMAALLPFCSITESEEFALEGTSRGRLAQPPVMSWDISNSIRLLGAPSNLAWNVSRDGASTTSLSNLCQRFTTLIVKNFFFVPSLKLPSFSLKPSPLVFSQQVLLKSLSPYYHL